MNYFNLLLLRDYENLYSSDQPSELAWGSVKLQGLLGRTSSAIVSPKRTILLLEALGITRSKFTSSGNNWTVGQTVATFAWCKEKGNDSHLVWAPLNIMESGHSYVFLCSRYVLCWRDPELTIFSIISSWRHLNYISQPSSGTSFSCTICYEPINALHWLAFIFPSSELQNTSQTPDEENLLWIYWLMAYLCNFINECMVLELHLPY